MFKKLNVLMIDDHPLILEGYRNTLQEFAGQKKLNLSVETALNCDEALLKLNNSKVTKKFDIVFLDINLPPSKNQEFLSGEDLGVKIKKDFSSSSLIVLTMFSDNLRLINIMKRVDPDAFLIKSDIDPKEFLKAIDRVTEGKKYYSQTISEVMRHQVVSDIVLDQNDQIILYYLSEGIRTKDLVEKVPLSLAAIEKKKRMLKEIFEVEGEGDLALINKAKKSGFL